MLSTDASAKRFVDKYRRELNDAVLGPDEEEVGAFGHDQSVILAEEKGSTTAKITSAVHVPHKDATTADIEANHIEDEWNEKDIKIMEGFANGGNKVTTNPAKKEGEGEGEEGEEGQ